MSWNDTTKNLVDGAVAPRALAPSQFAQGFPCGIRPPKHIEPMDVLADWSNAQKCSLAADTVNWLAGKAAYQSVKLTADGSGTTSTMDKVLGTPIDLTGTFVHLLVYIHPGIGTADPVVGANSFVIYLRDSANNWSSPISILYFENGRVDGSGWHEGSAVPTAAQLGACDIADVKTIRLGCSWLGGSNATVSITYDRLAFLPIAPATASKPVWIVTLDDVLASDYQDQAMAYAAALGIPVTAYAIATWGSAATLARLQLHHWFNQHLIGNHSYSHKYWVTHGLTAAEKFDEFYLAAAWLQANGMGAGARHFAIPGGTVEARGQNVRFDWLGLHARTFRVTNRLGYGWREYGPAGMYDVLAVDSAATAATALDGLLAAGNGFGLVLFHPTTSALLTEFKTHMDYLKTKIDAGSVYAVTLETLTRGWTPPV